MYLGADDCLWMRRTWIVKMFVLFDVLTFLAQLGGSALQAATGDLAKLGSKVRRFCSPALTALQQCVFADRKFEGDSCGDADRAHRPRGSGRLLRRLHQRLGRLWPAPVGAPLPLFLPLAPAGQDS